jgi:hypothetical protein
LALVAPHLEWYNFLYNALDPLSLALPSSAHHPKAVKRLLGSLPRRSNSEHTHKAYEQI